MSSTQNLKANSSVGESEFGLAHFSRGPHHGNRGELNINNQHVHCTMCDVYCTWLQELSWKHESAFQCLRGKVPCVLF